VKKLLMIARSCGYTTHRDVAAAQAIRFSRIVWGGTLPQALKKMPVEMV